MRSIIAKGGVVVAMIGASWLMVAISRIVTFATQEVGLIQSIGIKLGLSTAPALIGSGLLFPAAQATGLTLIGVGIYWAAVSYRPRPKSQLGLAMETATVQAAVDRHYFKTN